MESIQRQYAESLAFELVEFKNMVAIDEAEPAFGSVLNFQNTSAEKQTFKLGSARCSWIPVYVGPVRARNCVEVEVTPEESNLEINIGAPNTIWTSERANEVLRVLCDIVPLLIENAGARLCELGF